MVSGTRGRYHWRSPSLRGSGLKCLNDGTADEALQVSLFTREWIEIRIALMLALVSAVSLFTREWIEIVTSIA